MTLDSKVALVTGCSSGIGEATALELARAGYHVYATGRTMEGLESLEGRAREEGLSLTTRVLDVSNPKSVDTTISEIKKETDRLDVLVNNAGYALLGAIEDIPMEDLRMQFDVNVFSLVALYKNAIPLMRRNGGGTIFNISSVAGRISVPIMGVYCASKFCVEALSLAMRNEVHQFGIKVVTIEPGPVNTRFSKNALKASGKILNKKDTPYRRAYENILAWYEDFGPGVPPQKVARIILKTTRKKRPKARYAVRLRDRLFMTFGSLIATRIGQRGVRWYFSLNLERA